MNRSTQLNLQTDQLNSVLHIIKEIEVKSSDGACIYRGEPECYEKVSSTLYREYAHIKAELFDLEVIQREILNEAKKHVYKTGDFEILTELQHYGGKTNLIDFTADYQIALFFACDSAPNKNGRVIVQKTEAIRDWIQHPRNPRHRVSVQKNVFVRPPKGFIEPHKDDIVTIPANLKQPLLQHLRKSCDISTQTIYNDLYSFIKNQDIHRTAYVEFYSGLAFQNIENEAQTPEERQTVYEKAVAHYTEALKQKPDFPEAYYNRGVTYDKKGEVDNAIADYSKAIQLDPEFALAYNNRGIDYAAKGDFDNAIADYTKAIELQPNHANAYYNRGIDYAAKGDFDNAIADYTKAIELQPNHANAYCNRGVAYLKKGDFNNAIADYNKAIEIKPDYAEAYYNRNLIWLANKNWGKARADLPLARDNGLDITATFRRTWESVEDFEQKTGIQLPEDIAALLTPQ